ncbi:hypothetical protein ACC806_38435, partial [Rhizobium ruizarguesonis]
KQNEKVSTFKPTEKPPTPLPDHRVCGARKKGPASWPVAAYLTIDRISPGPSKVRAFFISLSGIVVQPRLVNIALPRL